MAVPKTDIDIFSKSGPFHLTSIDWSNLYHRTAVAASLVKGVSVLQRLGENEAKLWWESFHFTLSEQLINKDDNFIYGAIFEYQDTHLESSSPRYVIAFRGTILKRETVVADMILNICIAFDQLHRRSRVLHAVQTIRTVLDIHNNSKDVWLVGHSLGAAIALLAGKTMIEKSGISLETYAFNPPISAIPLNRITDNDAIKIVCRVGWSFFKDAALDRGEPEQNQEDHTNIASWIPHLYVNTKDLICSEYLGIFNHRNVMSLIGASKIETTTARKTFRSRIFGIIGEGTSSSSYISTDRLHILPSAKMVINQMDKSAKFEVVHGLHQWWVPEANARNNWEIKIITPTINENND